MKKKKSNAGFTLTELIVVIAILGVLMAVAVPTYGAIVERARGNICKNNTASINYALSISRQEQPIADESIKDDEAMKEALSGFFPEGLPKCPGGGSYGYNKNCTVYCKKHQSPTLTIPMDTLETMKDLIAEVVKIQSSDPPSERKEKLEKLLGVKLTNDYVSNEKLREAIHKKFNGTWLSVTIENKTIYCQTMNNEPKDFNEVIIYGNGKNESGVNWNAPYVFHPEENCWYKYVETNEQGKVKNFNLAGYLWSKENKGNHSVKSLLKDTTKFQKVG